METHLRQGYGGQAPNLEENQNTKHALEWSAPSTPHFKRGRQWYLCGGIAVIALAAWGIITDSWSFAIVMVLIAGVYVLLREARPASKNIRIEGGGVTFENEFTAWGDCTGFWLIRTPEYAQLHISRRDPKKGVIRILTGDVNPETIRGLLSQYLKEQSGKEERLLDIFIRICKL